MVQKEKACVMGSAKEWLLLLLIDTLIAILIALIMGGGLMISLLHSHSIGTSIAGLIWLITRARGQIKAGLSILIIAVPGGTLFGVFLVQLITGGTTHILGFTQLDAQVRMFAFSTLIGVAVAWYFYDRAKQQETQVELERKQLQAEKHEKAITESRLKVLQAQIEPHFLFNTLSTVVSLIDTKPQEAQSMLLSLTSYLRASLDRTREEKATVKDELNLLDAYLAIQKIRMGKRLHYTIEAEPSLESEPLPPLLLQPLVENALIHGIEPKLEGGGIAIKIEKRGAMMTCSVTDSGQGMDLYKQGEGIGLVNIRERLHSLYGDSARLEFAPGLQCGVVASITFDPSGG